VGKVGCARDPDNPRYRGHQVWNKQRKDEILIDVEDVGLGHETRMRWNDTSAWVWSQEPVHEALIGIETFEAAQTMFTRTRRATRRTPAIGRQYVFAGLIRCGLCERRMQGQWNHGQPYYRCKYSSQPGGDPHPKSIYVREGAPIPDLDGWLCTLFDADHIDATAEILAGADEPDAEVEARHAELRDRIRNCDRRVQNYRAALDEGGEIATIAKWIAEVERERRGYEAALGRDVPGGKLTKTQVRALVEALRDIVAVLSDADVEDKAALYTELGVSLTHHPDGRVQVETRPRGVEGRVGGGTRTLTPRGSAVGEFTIAV
jgi:hypothetical protein